MNGLRHLVIRSMMTTSGQRPGGLDLVRSMALALRLRTLLRAPYLDPRDLAYADGFELEPCPGPLEGMSPCGASDGVVIRWQWVSDPRKRGLFVAHALAEGLFIRHHRGYRPSAALRWALTVELLFPSAFTKSSSARVLATRQGNAPTWLAQAIGGHPPSGVFPRPILAV